MARFVTSKRSSRLRGPLISVLIFAFVFFAFLTMTEQFSEDTRSRQLEALETAIQQSIVYCYTLEGCYPESLEYLKEHYGLIYNEQLFYVDYRLQGANIMPDVTIIERGKQQ